MPSISFVRREPIQKGWSDDKKYRIRDEKGNSYLLRLSHASQYEGKKREFFNMKQAAALGVPMCQPLDFGLCEEGVYSIQSWIDGVEAEAIMETFPKEKQYRYGWEAGQALRKIHSIPSPPKHRGLGEPLQPENRPKDPSVSGLSIGIRQWRRRSSDPLSEYQPTPAEKPSSVLAARGFSYRKHDARPGRTIANY